VRLRDCTNRSPRSLSTPDPRRRAITPKARGCPCHLARTLAAGILPFARSEASALSPSGLRWPPTPARWHGQPRAVFSKVIKAPDGSPGVRLRDCTNRLPRNQLIPDSRRRAITNRAITNRIARRLCSNVVVDHASGGVVVPPTCPTITPPPDFRPGLLCRWRHTRTSVRAAPSGLLAVLRKPRTEVRGCVRATAPTGHHEIV
jgi:hypothetical protein